MVQQICDILDALRPASRRVASSLPTSPTAPVTTAATPSIDADRDRARLARRADIRQRHRRDDRMVSRERILVAPAARGASTPDRASDSCRLAPRRGLSRDRRRVRRGRPRDDRWTAHRSDRRDGKVSQSLHGVLARAGHDVVQLGRPDVRSQGAGCNFRKPSLRPIPTSS